MAVDKEVYDKDLIRMIVTDYQPLSLVENEGFIEFVKILQPDYILPSKKVVSEILLPNEHRIVHKILSSMNENILHLCISTDLWTSDSNKTYITITGHFIWEYKLKSCVLGTEEMMVNHTAQNISEAIINILSRFPGSLNKVSVVVTDITSDIQNAVTDYLKKTHQPCVAHTLNLSVQETITKSMSLQIVLNKCRALYTHFKRNNIARYKLRTTQEQMSLPVLKLKRDMPTCWTSILFMIERFSEVRIPLSASLISLINAPENLEASEWAIIDDIIPILKPIQKITEELSEEEYPMLSRIIPLLRGLQYVLSTKSPTTDVGTTLKNYSMEVLCQKLGSSETHETIALSTLLDPRFKKTGFGVPENANNTEKWLTELANQISMGCSNSTSTVVTVVPNVTMRACKDEEDDLWKLFDQEALAQTSSETFTSPATLEIKQYLEMPLIHRKEDPLHFWETQTKSYPILSQLAIKYLCIPASSMPSKHIFSKAGILNNQRRNRLTSKLLDEIIFLNKNFDLI